MVGRNEAFPSSPQVNKLRLNAGLEIWSTPLSYYLSSVGGPRKWHLQQLMNKVHDPQEATKAQRDQWLAHRRCWRELSVVEASVG
jgi:hypothetical protein